MATTVSAGFNLLKSNLEITGLQKTTVSQRQQNVRDAVAKDLSVLNSFVTGSYARYTMIAPLKDADIDIFVVLDPSYFNTYTPASLLDKVRATLIKTYPKTPKISRNGQAVTITFTDFLVDVVPSFYRNGGGYLIPDSIGSRWISTDPTVHQSHMTQANSIHNGDLVPLVKMIKGWNRCISSAFYGFYLELMVKSILDGVRISDYPSGVRYVFDKGREKIKYTMPDPAGLDEEQVGGLNHVSTVQDAQSRFETAYNRAIKAEMYEAQGYISSAFAEWKKIFDGYFPAYG